MLDRLSFKREKIVDIQKALKTADVNQDNKLDFEEWRANLKSYVLPISFLSLKYIAMRKLNNFQSIFFFFRLLKRDSFVVKFVHNPKMSI